MIELGHDYIIKFIKNDSTFGEIFKITRNWQDKSNVRMTERVANSNSWGITSKWCNLFQLKAKFSHNFVRINSLSSFDQISSLIVCKWKTFLSSKLCCCRNDLNFECRRETRVMSSGVKASARKLLFFIVPCRFSKIFRSNSLCIEKLLRNNLK